MAGITHDLVGWRADPQGVFRPKLPGFLLAHERFELLLRRRLELNHRKVSFEVHAGLRDVQQVELCAERLRQSDPVLQCRVRRFAEISRHENAFHGDHHHTSLSAWSQGNTYAMAVGLEIRRMTS